MAGERNYLGEFEQVVLLAIWRLEGDGYGATIRSTLRETGGRECSIGALYSTLDRLESKGLVRSRFGAPTTGRGGRLRRVYRISAAGQRALERSRTMLEALWHGVGGAS